ncbi:helix-turn-helix domain-containing protein [Arthrobacter sp. NPDC056493]|uniref:helix-turn-helix domain-containing protein n=1 Tax=Arthrobacter sp. NPDC056493 TaxID=3345839 RepID=UPI0036706BD8
MAEPKRLEAVIGENIRRFRGEMSQAELGEKVGELLGGAWSRSTVSQAESGKRAFVAAEIVALAQIFNRSIPEMYRRYDFGNVVISDSFVMSRTDMLRHTMAMDPSALSQLIFTAADKLDEARNITRRAIEDLGNAEQQQEWALDILTHAGRNEVVEDDPNA